MKRLLILLLCGFCISTVHADGLGADLFAGGRTRLSLAGGYGSFNDHNYGVVGLGAGYYVIQGLEAGIDGEAWLGSRPHIYSLSPRLTYTFVDLASFYPYVGIFYRRIFYDSGYMDINSIGGRAGITAPLSSHAYASAGIVYEHLYQCNTALYDNCSQVYPEIALAFVY